MSAVESFGYEVADDFDDVGSGMILDYLSGVIVVSKRKLPAPFCLDYAGTDFLQMFLVTLIIAESELYKLIGREAFVDLAQKIFDSI